MKFILLPILAVLAAAPSYAQDSDKDVTVSQSDMDMSEYEDFRAYAAGSEDEKVRERASDVEIRVKKLMPNLKF